MRIPYEDIVAKIKEKKGISDSEIEAKVSEKLKQLSGLISKEGAATIIANEYGISLLEAGRLKVKNITAGMRDVEVVVKVTRKYNLINFTSKDRPGKVCSIEAGDETGIIRIAFWHDTADKAVKLNIGDIIKIRGAYVKENNGRNELHINDRSVIMINPEGETVSSVAATQNSANRKKIKDITEQDQFVEIFGTVVQVSDIKFFETCPACTKKVFPKDDKFVCPEHGEVHPGYSYVVNIVLDDGTETIRATFFRRQAEQLLGKTQEETILFKDFPQNFEEAKKTLLGTQIIVSGKVVKNQMFNTTEIIANEVNLNPDIQREISAVEQELAKDDRKDAP